MGKKLTYETDLDEDALVHTGLMLVMSISEGKEMVHVVPFGDPTYTLKLGLLEQGKDLVKREHKKMLGEQ